LAATTQRCFSVGPRRTASGSQEKSATLAVVKESVRTSLGEIYREPDSPLVVLRRSSTPALDEDELLDMLDRFDAILPPSRRRTLVFLMDMRDGPMRNDEEYEQRMNHAMQRLCAGFARVAVPMRSSVGILQASRLRREHPIVAGTVRPFLDETQARSYLLTSSEKPSP